MSTIAKKVGAAAAGVGGDETGSYIVCGTSSGTVHLLDHTTKGSLSTADTYNVGNQCFDYAFSPDGNYIACVSNGNVYLLDHTTRGSLSLATTYTTSGGFGCAWSPDGNYLAIGFNNNNGQTLRTLNHTTAGSLSTQDTHSVAGYGSAADFSYSGDYLTVAGVQSPYFTMLTVNSSGNLSSGTTFSTVGELPLSGKNCTFSPDDNYIAVAQDGSPYFRLLSRSGSSVSSAATLTLARGRACCFSGLGDYIAFTQDSSTNGLRLIDHTTAGSVSLAASLNTPNSARSVDFSNDGQYIVVTCEGDHLLLADHTTAGSLSQATTFSISGLGLYGVAFSPD